MNVVGRQVAESISTARHQRQYSDNFLDASFNSNWFPSSQDFGLYGGGRMNRKSPEPGTPPLSSRSLSLRKNGDEYVSPSELSPGLLDLHSFDTELLTEVPNLYEGYGLRKYVLNRPLGMAENNLLKIISVDKERATNVAKVRKRPLNKKEIAKKEEDIISIESTPNALTVHERKLKLSHVSAHRRQVENTMEMVREEMDLLVEADQPGNHLDNYLCKLNTILSQKAAGIVQLQARLAQFQKHLQEYNVF